MHMACLLKRRHSWCKSWTVHDISGLLYFDIVVVFHVHPGVNTIDGYSAYSCQSGVCSMAYLGMDIAALSNTM